MQKGDSHRQRAMNTVSPASKTAHLVSIAIGPVQSFIAQARRTRDLWFGSFVLSELSRAAARSMTECPDVQLIFPGCDSGASELELFDPCAPLSNPGLSGGFGKVNITNKLLVRVGPEGDPEKVVRAARNGANQLLRRFGDCFLERHGVLVAPPALVEREVSGPEDTPIKGSAWTEQLDTFLEFYAAILPLPLTEPYPIVRNRLITALESRKKLRDFPSWHFLRGAVPKSSLDGMRETVLADPAELAPGKLVKFERAKVRFRISPGEQLDAMGLIKRTGGRPEQFIPVANVALAAWLQHLRDDKPDVSGESLLPLKNRLLQQANRSPYPDDSNAMVSEEDPSTSAPSPKDDPNGCHSKDMLNRIVFPVCRPDVLWVFAFPSDAQLLLENRWEALLKDVLKEEPKSVGHSEGEPGQPNKDQHPRWRTWANKHVRPLLNAISKHSDMPKEPHPYVACLVADGDHMGKFLDQIQNWESHQKVSRRLSKFAMDCRKIVEQDHMGSLVYAGGDDVLAFVCMTDALQCAQALKTHFHQQMKLICNALKNKEPSIAGRRLPTLSVGIGIGHMLDNMADLLDMGRNAEKLAKKGSGEGDNKRNALAILLDKRSGGQLVWRASWDEDPVALLGQIQDRMQEGTLTIGKIHEIRDCLGRLPAPDNMESAESARWGVVLQAEVTRILRRTRGEQKLEPKDVGLIFNKPEVEKKASDYRVIQARVREWLQQALIALEFMRARKAGGSSVYIRNIKQSETVEDTVSPQ